MAALLPPPVSDRSRYPDHPLRTELLLRLAFGRLGMWRVTARTDTRNVPPQGVLDRIEMRKAALR